jgi:hypothetical protein
MDLAYRKKSFHWCSIDSSRLTTPAVVLMAVDSDWRSPGRTPGSMAGLSPPPTIRMEALSSQQRCLFSQSEKAEHRTGDDASGRAALARYSDVIDLWYRGGDWANQWLSLRHVFGIFMQLRDYHGAATLHGALSAAGAAYALPFEASDAQRISGLVDDLRERLGAATFAASVRSGVSMSDGDLIAFVRTQIRALSS